MFRSAKKRSLRNLSGGKGKKGKILLTIFFLIFLLLFLILLFWFFKVLKVEAISENTKCLDGINLENEIGILGQSIFLVDKKQIESSLRKKYSCIGSVQINRKFPFEIIVKVSGKRAVFELILNKKPIFGEINLMEASQSTQEATIKIEPNNESGKSFLVDTDGRIFEIASKNEGIQKIEYVKNSLEIGEILESSKVRNALTIFEKLKEYQVPVTRVIWDGDVLFFDHKPQLVFSLTKDPARQSASLQLILQKAKMNSKEMDKIDLRFDKIVVVYSPKKK